MDGPLYPTCKQTGTRSDFQYQNWDPPGTLNTSYNNLNHVILLRDLSMVWKTIPDKWDGPMDLFFPNVQHLEKLSQSIWMPP